MDKEKSGQIQVYGLFHCPFPEKLWSESGIPEPGWELSGVATAWERLEDSPFFQRHGRRHLQRLLGAGRRGGDCLPGGAFPESGVFLRGDHSAVNRRIVGSIPTRGV